MQSMRKKLAQKRMYGCKEGRYPNWCKQINYKAIKKVYKSTSNNSLSKNKKVLFYSRKFRIPLYYHEYHIIACLSYSRRNYIKWKTKQQFKVCVKDSSLSRM